MDFSKRSQAALNEQQFLGRDSSYERKDFMAASVLTLLHTFLLASWGTVVELGVRDMPVRTSDLLSRYGGGQVRGVV